MAVDARTGIPTAVGLLAVVDYDLYLVLPFFLLKQIRCDVDGKGRVAVSMLPGLLSVHHDDCILVYPFEMELHHFCTGCCEVFLVFGFSCVIPAAARSRDACLGIRSSEDVPVMGQVHGGRRSVMGEQPAVVEELL